ncbi:hypothetical protein [Sphaerothrix gracilis]|uniref:hypothetical protein n=1 Tax=Sphaerothrix gracilis TaxID=3151835 RepID=UPI0031FCD94D
MPTLKRRPKYPYLSLSAAVLGLVVLGGAAIGLTNQARQSQGRTTPAAEKPLVTTQDEIDSIESLSQ